MNLILVKEKSDQYNSNFKSVLVVGHFLHALGVNFDCPTFISSMQNGMNAQGKQKPPVRKVIPKQVSQTAPPDLEEVAGHGK